MKIVTVTALPLLVAGALVPAVHRTEALAETNRVVYQELHKRQFWDTVGGVLSRNLPSLIQWGASNLSWLLKWTESPVKFAQLRPEVDSKATKISLGYGPFLLTGANESTGYRPHIQMDPKSTLFLRTLKGIPWNAAILSSKIRLAFDDGSDADLNQGIYIHHLLVADLSKPSAPFALCPNLHKEDNIADWAVGYLVESVGAGLIQTGNDAAGGANIYMPKKGNLKSAFLTGRDDIFGIQGEIVNYNPNNRSVFLNLELEYLEQKPADYLDASTIAISATGCKGPTYTAQQNSRQFNHTSEKFDITQDGFIINARGHLHDGGTALELLLNGRVVCRSVPTYGHAKSAEPGSPETILEMSWCHDSVPIKKGDALTLKTYYDVDAHPLRQNSEMGGGGHGHGGGGHGKESEKKQGGGGMGMGMGMSMGGEMEEMGIMTTNFAWNVPADAKGAVSAQQQANTQPAKGESTGSWLSSLFGGSSSPSPTTTQPNEPKKVESGSWLSNLFGGSSTTSSPQAQPTSQKDVKDSKATTTAAASAPSPSSSCNWFTSLFGCTDAPKASTAPAQNQPAQMSGHSHS